MATHDLVVRCANVVDGYLHMTWRGQEIHQNDVATGALPGLIRNAG